MTDSTGKTTFVPDAGITEISEAYALDAVDFLREHARIDLDWTEKSIERMETVLASMHRSYLSGKPRPPEDKVMEFARMFGSYVGEVIRRNHGGEWGMITMGGQEFPGLRQTSGGLIWPWGRARNRLVQGPEDNMYHYYISVTRR